MVTMTVKVDDAKVLAALSRMAARGRDMTPLMRDIGEHLLITTRERFETEKEHAPDGESWAGISAAWARKKQRRKRGVGRILTFRGYLRGSLTCMSHPVTATASARRSNAAKSVSSGVSLKKTAGPYGGKVAVVLPHGRVPRVFKPVRFPASPVRARPRTRIGRDRPRRGARSAMRRRSHPPHR